MSKTEPVRLKDRFFSTFRQRGRQKLGNLIKAIFGLFANLIPIIETLFLTFVISRHLESTSTGIILFIVLMIGSFIWHSLVKGIAWGTMIYLTMTQEDSSGMLFAVIFALAVGVLRFLLEKWLRK
ncbi:MAG: hypothetical protein ACOX0J_04970 [Thermoactinomyces vulgaris]